MTLKTISTVSLALLLSVVGIAENLIWNPVPDATGYRVLYGIVGGTTNQINATTNLQTWVNPVSGTNIVGWPGVSNLNLTLDKRYFFYVLTVIQSTNVSVVSDPSAIVFYTPRSSPTNQLVIGR